MDEDNFTIFYKQTFPHLWAYVFRVTQDRSLADEIAQESFVRLLQEGTKGREFTNQRSYVFAIASNLMREYWRRSMRFEELPVEEQDVPSVIKNEDVDTRIDFAESYKKLSDIQRALLWLAYVERCDHSEIAGMLNLKKNSVRVLLYRAREKMQALLMRGGLKGEVKA